ncbi:uncharacterized protein LOC124125526 [Haliotis rufescens]|uniref:uncharacterized protein LOC124125526 n=1 Tax=Haliotis rufescens TaxID=6454 RepID=UPI00201E7787|nr:uncharacterized protein LOC124125526 [Haliotis rufescens]
MEMEDIAEEESRQAAKIMGEMIDDLGVCPLPDAPPEIRLLMSSYSSTVPVVDASSDGESGHSDQTPQASNIESPPVSSSNSVNTPSNPASLVAKIKQIPQAPHKQSGKKKILTSKKRVRLASRFPCRTRSGMSCAVNTAWHKRGFDSLT